MYGPPACRGLAGAVRSLQRAGSTLQPPRVIRLHLESPSCQMTLAATFATHRVRMPKPQSRAKLDKRRAWMREFPELAAPVRPQLTPQEQKERERLLWLDEFRKRLSYWAQKYDLNRLELVFARMQHLGHTPEAVHYEQLMEGYSLAKQPDKVADVLSRMQAAGVEPQPTTYELLAWAYVKSGRLSDADAVLGQVTSPSDDLGGILVNAHVSAGSVDRAVELLQSIQPRLPDPTSPTLYNALLHGLARLGTFDEVERRFAEMEVSGVKPDAESYGAIVAVHVGRGDVAKAEETLKGVTEGLELVPTVHMMEQLAKGHTAAGDFDAARRYLENKKRLQGFAVFGNHFFF